MSALDLVLASRRPDVIAKFLLARSYFANGEFDPSLASLYERCIYALNRGFEPSPVKVGTQDFLAQYQALCRSLQTNGYLDDIGGGIPIDNDLTLVSSAHRVSASAALGLAVPVYVTTPRQHEFDERFLRSRGISEQDLDWLALERCLLDSEARIFLIHQCNPPDRFEIILDRLERSVRVMHTARVLLRENAYIRLKKINYPPSENPWAGSRRTGYQGLVDHAAASYGEWPLGIVVARPRNESLDDVKRKLRAECGLSNTDLHSTDSHSETKSVARHLLNMWSVYRMNTVPLGQADDFADWIGVQVVDWQRNWNVRSEEVVVVGSSAMAVWGLRNPRDIDLLTSTTRSTSRGRSTGWCSEHNKDLDHYDRGFFGVANDPRNHLWIDDLRYLSPSALLNMKRSRSEVPKDLADAQLLEQLIAGQYDHKNHWTNNFTNIRFKTWRVIHVWKHRIRLKVAGRLRITPEESVRAHLKNHIMGKSLRRKAM